MDYPTLFRQFCNQTASVNEHARAMRADAARQLKTLLEEDERRKLAGLPADYVVQVQNMSFRMATTGDHFFYDFRQHSIRDQVLSLKVRTNRQYQWLLAEAYEHFEDFLEYAYAAAALIDRGFWPLRDYGTFKSSDLCRLTFDQLLQQAKMKKDKPYSLMNAFREQLPVIKAYEATNAIDANLWFFLHLIEKLRHHIVHTGGRIASKEEFSRDVLKKSGLLNGGSPNEVYLNWIDAFLQKDGSEHLIYLLEQSVPSDGLLNTYINVFEELLRKLMAYAHIVASAFASIEPAKGGAAADA